MNAARSDSMSDLTAHVADQPLPLSKFHRLSSGDMAMIRRHSSATFGIAKPEIDLERRGATFHFVHNQFDLSRTSLHVLDYNCSDCAVRIDMQIQQFLLLQFSLRGEAELSQDGMMDRISPGQFKIIHGDSPLRGRLLPGYRSMILLVPRAALSAALAEQIGQQPKKPLIFEAACFGEDGRGAALASLCKTLCANLDTGGPAFMRGPVARRMEDLIISLILWSLPHNYTEEFERDETSAPYYVRRVERHIAQNAATALSFADLVAASGVSDRTLHYGFRKYRNTTPMASLKSVRLELARRALLEPAGRRVVDIAMDCGFPHLGKFAVDYRERFGERPSETLRRHLLMDRSSNAAPNLLCSEDWHKRR
ncbi:AraC family transcriptional regulator [Bradyrhizobium sp. 2TAF36]|uniref:AraC family transcriptional regulator n=1 Tax=Bradyrhizobium sp. 2TAF36 TaxID=3233016 RepID=UPI003F8DAC2B